MNNHSSLHYQAIIQKLQDYCANQYSGTLFITTNNNHSIRFIVKNGIIVFIAYRFKYGNDALPLIQKMETGTASFKEDVFVGNDDPNLLDTSTLLQILSNTQKPSPSGINDDADEAKPQSPMGGGQNTHTSSLSSFVFNEKIKRVKTELALFIGPIAQVICEEYIEDYGQPTNNNEWKEMLDTLAEEISDQAKQEQFKTTLTDP